MASLGTLETFSDKARAFALALLVHLGLAALLLAGMLLVPKAPPPISLQGPVIEAELVGLTAAPPPRSASRTRPAPKPAETPPPVKPPEPAPQPPTQVQRQDLRDQEKIADMAQQKAEQAERAEEEKHRQEQVLLEQQQQKERERAKLLEQVKRERAEAEKKLKLEKEKLAQLQDLDKQQKPVKTVAQNVPPADKPVTGNNGPDNSLAAQYYAAIQNAVTNNWLRPDTTNPGVLCRIHIVQIPGGEVIGVQITNPCNADPLTRNSIEQAVKRAAPLPYKSYEQVFARDINLDFKYDG
jgi:colicin import membrane protein